MLEEAVTEAARTFPFHEDEERELFFLSIEDRSASRGLCGGG
jgi:hypothetical protein